MGRHRQLLIDMFDCAIKAADPAAAMARHMPPRPPGRTIVVGAGKAASRMASIMEEVWDGPLEGVVVDRHGVRFETRQIKGRCAAHPVPDADGMRAAQMILDAVQGLTRDDLVIALISGGGSALLPAPCEGLDLADEIALNRALLSSGAPIGAMNVIRTQISRIKGGRLAEAARPARVVSFIVSDVAGDDPALVASGPTIAQKEGAETALDLIARYRIAIPERLLDVMRTAAEAAPGASAPESDRDEVHIVASAALSLEAATRHARDHGLAAHILSDSIEGEAYDIGRMHAALARQVLAKGQPFRAPLVMLSGGETTVSISGQANGKGGRNSEFLLSFACDIAGSSGIEALAADTDGIDGSETNAGAFADGTTLARLAQKGHNARMLLANHDAWTGFAAIEDLFVTGPTGTNVNDFRAIIIDPIGPTEKAID